MDALRLSVALYDAVAVLVPGFVLPATLSLLWQPSLQVYSLNPWAVVTFSFISGHTIQMVCRIVYNQVDRLWPPKGFMDSASEELRQVIDSFLQELYGVAFSKETLGKHRKDLCYSPVWNRMENYKLFTALADLHRALGVLSLIVSAEFAIRASMMHAGWSLGVLPRSPTTPWLNWLLSALAAMAFVLLTDRGRFFRRLADGVVYHSFLSYISEMCFAQKTTP